MLVIYVLVILFWSSTVWADEKACPEQLVLSKVKAQNLDEQRDRVTQEKSQVQVQLYRAQQELQQLKQELADLKKPKEEKPKE